MLDFVWLAVVGLAGWASGKIAGGKGFGRVADVLLGISGGFLVRFAMEQLVFPLEYVYLVLFSIWGAVASPAMVRLLVRRHGHLKSEPGKAPAPFVRERSKSD